MIPTEIAEMDIGLDIAARTLWGEARGDGKAGMLAVAWVIRNRAMRPGWWGRDLRSVCLKDRQFSCWNGRDPNRPKMTSLKADDPAYVRAARLMCDVMLADKEGDPTREATHYHARYVDAFWAAGHEPCFETAGHLFYNDIP